MAITQGATDSFLRELGTVTHDFTASTGDTFKIALYTSSATIGTATTVYTTAGEVVGAGYSAGGNTLVSSTPVVSGGVAMFDFADTGWASSTITARGALIYNATKGNKAVAVLDFGSDKVSSNTTFLIQFPVPTSTTAIIRAARA